jgi:hypothetical protein
MSFLCDGCGKKIEKIANRFHCHLCEDFDLCENCYNLKKCVNSHNPKHPIQKIVPPLVDNLNSEKRYICDVCDERISDDAPRYNCLICEDYDLCKKCQKVAATNNKNPHSNTHSMCYYLKSSPKNENKSGNSTILFMYFNNLLLFIIYIYYLLLLLIDIIISIR